MLLDTSGLLALLDVREPRHHQARDEYARRTRRFTHGFVLAELIALANARGLPSEPIVQFLMSLLVNPDIITIWPDESLTSRALALLQARRGRGYSLCDAVSFIIMRDQNLVTALSTDQHFAEEGFQTMLS